MADLNVIVAAYGSLDDARADWGALDRAPVRETHLLDSVLIERSDLQVTVVHRCSSRGWARGSVAGALVGRLSPTALLTGAIAGGVGVRTMSFVSRGLSRDAVNELGRVLDSGSFVTVAITEGAHVGTATSYGVRAATLASLPLSGSLFDLRMAVLADDADE